MGPTTAARLHQPHQLVDVARAVGLPQVTVERIRMNPSFAERVLDRIRVRAIYLLAEAIEPQGDLAKSNDRAAALLARIAAGESSGRSVVINNQNNQLTENIQTTAQSVKGDSVLLQRSKALMGRLGLTVVERGSEAATAVGDKSTVAGPSSAALKEGSG